MSEPAARDFAFAVEFCSLGMQDLLTSSFGEEKREQVHRYCEMHPEALTAVLQARHFLHDACTAVCQELQRAGDDLLQGNHPSYNPRLIIDLLPAPVVTRGKS